MVAFNRIKFRNVCCLVFPPPPAAYSLTLRLKPGDTFKVKRKIIFLKRIIYFTKYIFCYLNYFLLNNNCHVSLYFRFSRKRTIVREGRGRSHFLFFIFFVNLQLLFKSSFQSSATCDWKGAIIFYFAIKNQITWFENLQFFINPPTPLLLSSTCYSGTCATCACFSRSIL